MTYQETKKYLEENGLPTKYAWALHQLNRQADVLLKRDPFILVRQLKVPFRVVDLFAKRSGYDLTHRRRGEAAILGELEEAALRGHCFVRRARIEAQAAANGFAGRVDELLNNEELFLVEGDRVYTARLGDAERCIADDLHRILEGGTERDLNFEGFDWLTQQQLEAAHSTGVHSFTVITGGPGTGKTSILRAVVSAWRRAGLNVMLAAPTGRAAKRMSDATDVRATTIHRLLVAQPNENGWNFCVNRDAPLFTDLLVIDEASMLDTELTACVLEAVSDGTHVLFVGDVDQLPSVGPGSVLGDIIESGIVPVYRLTQIFRQADGSDIVVAAADVLTGQPPRSSKKPKGDFYLMPMAAPIDIRRAVLNLVANRIPKDYGVPLAEIQVLTPTHDGVAGRVEMNGALQHVINPNGQQIDRPFGFLPLRVGDRVIQTKNEYTKDVFNGDIGVVSGGGSNMLTVQFEDGREVAYHGIEMNQLDLAYALTVHKAQGGQYQAVVMVLLGEPTVMLKRNLLYTGITRGRRLTVLVGHENAWKRAAATHDSSKRDTGLVARLQENVSGSTGTRAARAADRKEE